MDICKHDSRVMDKPSSKMNKGIWMNLYENVQRSNEGH